jgi:hypothetical protein
MEWEPSSEVVGDFTWPGFGFEVVVTDSAAAVLGGFSGFELGPVEITASHSQPPNVPRKWPPLHELWVTKWVSLDQQRSTARRVSICGTCGTEFWEVDGAERVDSDWDAAAGQLVSEHKPRVPGAGIVVTEANLGIFRVREFPGWSFCTDDVVRAVEQAKLTNAGFLEVGDQVTPTQ